MAAVFFFALGGAACKEKEEQPSLPSGEEQTEDWRVSEGKYIFAEFDGEEDMNIVFGSTVFGRVSLNRDTAFIKSGTGSLKIEVTGNGQIHQDNQEMPALRLPTAPFSSAGENAPRRISDLTAYQYLGFDLYNATEKTLYPQVCINDGDCAHTLEAKPGWNSYEIELVAESFSPNTGFSERIGEVSYISWIFQRYEAAGGIQVFYLDNVILTA